MDNKYESMFPDDLTHKETSFLYYRLEETVMHDPEEREKLFEAYTKASAAALARDLKRFEERQEEARKKYAKTGMDCILCD